MAVVLSIEEYFALPELPIPALADDNSSGTIYEVHRIDFYCATEEECRRRNVDVEFNCQAEGCLLPTIIVVAHGARTVHRLPFALSAWANSIANIAGHVVKPFPSKVEFALRRNRYFAEILQHAKLTELAIGGKNPETLCVTSWSGLANSGAVRRLRPQAQPGRRRVRDRIPRAHRNAW